MFARQKIKFAHIYYNYKTNQKSKAQKKYEKVKSIAKRGKFFVSSWRHMKWVKILLFSFGALLICFLILWIELESRGKNSKTGPENTHDEVVVSYVYKKSTKRQRDNFIYFLNHGLTNKTNVRFVFTLNDAPSCEHKKMIPKQGNIEVLCRKNFGYDLCAHAEVMNDPRFKNKKYFLFLNGSARGPFSVSDCIFVSRDMPILYEYCKRFPNYKIFKQQKLYISGYTWIQQFIDLIQNSKTNGKIAGAYISCEKAPHVQSWFLVAHRDIMSHVNNSFKCYSDLDEAVDKGEVSLSSSLLEQGYNILSPIKEFRNVDFRKKVSKNLCRHTNPGVRFGFCPNSRCRSLHPLETIFFKNAGGLQRANLVDEKLQLEIHKLTKIKSIGEEEY